ncbi:hypothetical protein ANO14919_036560 [Xylariales sp. No.14919]|nr:hypothetical protein ANO14919_036560 [Xylariales sp. No.14919]
MEMSPSTKTLPQRVHLNDHDTVKIITVGKSKPGIARLTEEQSRKIDEELKILAGVIARARTDSPTNDAILTANGYVHKDPLKDALVKIGADHWHGKLQAMLEKGAYAYRAVRKDVTVGAIILTHHTEVPRTVDSPKTPPAGELTFPNLSNLEAVKAYPISDKNDKEFMR